MRKIFITNFLAFAFIMANAQTQFLNTVKIEFEKTIYVKQLVRATEPEWYERVKDRLQESSVTYFDFIADTTKSVYKPGKAVPYDPRAYFQGIADKNVVYNDYKTKTTITQKPVFEETFLVQDSLLRIKWKLTADTRNIAGFECRKAVGIIDDSIAVFAFYTDEILVNGGPESVNGLPGMILGMGVPRIHTTWFATKVEMNGVDMKKVVPATKGKKVDRKTMIGSLDKVLKEWGDYGKNLVFNYVI
ncbi:MAG TPA: GLPGLI family protein [Flavisolibacter sp.]|nr:GLPGLI family protein [Flavisolibacter sp.]